MFSVNFPLVFIYILEHLGKVRQGTLKLKFNISNHRNFSVNLPIVFIYFNFLRIKFKSNHQENLKNIAKVKFYKGGQNPKVLYYLI